MKRKTYKTKKSFFSHIPTTSSASLLVLAALCVVGPVHAQDTEDQEIEEVYVRGLRASLQSAQDLKRNASSIVDSVVAEDIGKLPDRSIAEALARVPGVSVNRFDQPNDPEHFAGEGAGVSVRGLPQVRAELNGRDIFSANDGRSLSFDDVPAELMAGVDVYKTPTADMIEGGLGGIVNLRTRMPFDKDEQVISGTVKANYGSNIEEWNYEGSVLYSNVFDVGDGRFGFLIDLSTSETSSRADNLYNRAYFPREVNGDSVYVSKGADWRRNDYFRDRDGQYLALQWAPTDELEFYATGFRSKASREWYENAFFLDAGSFPEPPAESDWTFDDNNALTSGTLTSPSGIALGTSSRISSNESETSDYSFGGEWASGSWTITADYQRVESTATRIDDTLGTVIFPPSVYVDDLNGSDGPSIQDTNNTLPTLGNYSYGQMMTRPAANEAKSDAAKVDVQYDFEDSIVSSVKAGVRYAKKTADNREGFSWSARVQPWNRGSWEDGVYPVIADESLMEPFKFDDFQGGDANVPTEAWMFKRSALNDFKGTTAAMEAATPTQTGWVSMPNFEGNDTDGGANLNHPLNFNTQEDKTNAAYVRMDFELTEALMGNVGVRYAETKVKANGSFNSPGISTPNGGTAYEQPPRAISLDHNYSNVLPSLNLQYNASDEVVLRFSASQAIWKPEFWRTAALLTLGGEFDESAEYNPGDEITPDLFNFTLSTEGTNPALEPMLANQFDISAEWYFNEDGGMLYGALFKKDVSDFFRTQTVNTSAEGFNVKWDSYVNTGTADINGIELGGTYYFDNLPSPFDGFGVTANYTYVDSSTDVPTSVGVEAIDTDDTVIENQPLEGLAENTYNLALMYENYGFYARLAYNYTSEILQSVGPNGWNGNDNGVAWKLPVYADDYGQWDLSMGYDITEQVSVNFEAYNIGGAKTKGIMEQNAPGNHRAFVYSQDTRYGISVRATF
ncbi:TonB-dependent receptor [Alteromonadaceae bacterium Bs31]|nr:TonB-dependent receptor [Alteromonadaceae bacterium Bs31]